MTELEQCIQWLRERGLTVDRSDFPPAPMPALYVVNGHELTGMQVLDYADRLANGKSITVR